MKLLIILLFPVLCNGQIILMRPGQKIKFTPIGQDDSIHQEVFPSLGKYALLTTDFAIYDNVVHGSLEFIEAQKPIELNKARRKPVAIIKAKCK